jgi:transcriptional regulator with XRE-family HTH domain
MKHIGNEIDKILTQKRIKKKDFAEKLGMTAVNLSLILKKNSIDAELLEKFSNVLNLPISHWFDENSSPNNYINANNHSVALGNHSVTGDISLSNCQKELEHLKQLLEEKERTIQILMKNK